MKKQKGEIGYIKSQRITKLIHTIIMFGLSISMYLFGLYHLNTNKSLFTVFAVLGMLPASKSLVITIMYYRARECSDIIYNKISGIIKDNILYSLYLTMPQKSCTIDVMNFYNNTIIAYASGKINIDVTQEHILSILKSNGYDNITIKIFNNYEQYCSRIEQLKDKNMLPEDKEIKSIHNIMHIIKQISL